jgi:hypothetical protein
MSGKKFMPSFRMSLMSGAVLPFIAGLALAEPLPSAPGIHSAPTIRAGAANPAAVPRPAGAPTQLAACNPCAANKGCNPCNPCAGAAGATSAACVVPRLAAANPCAVKKGCNPCNPCGAANPCNPCAAKKASNPCNPCAAKKPGNPCNPCGAATIAEITGDEAAATYKCLIGEMVAAYEKSGDPTAGSYTAWQRYNSVPYQSATHGSRYVNNYANSVAAAEYGKFEDAGPMPAGSLLAKDSFVVMPDGKVGPGPLFLMEKMANGFNEASQDWRYTLILPSGDIVGTTGGAGSENMTFCHECHVAMEDQDSMWFLPDEFRASQ